MQVYHDISQVGETVQPTVVAIGNFDGCHLGHQHLLAKVIETAKRLEAKASILTFYPHPVEVLYPDKKLERLSTADEKLELFEQFGIEVVLVQRFDSVLANLEPRQFYEQFLLQGLRAKQVHVGQGFCFGKGKSGNTKILQKMAAADRIEVDVAPVLKKEGKKISSSSIREYVKSGEVQKAAEYLGRPYSLVGDVIAGERRGSQIGFPTANVHCSSEKILPKFGVYVTRTHWQKQSYLSVSNVGVRPTFEKLPRNPSVEVHLLEFNEDIYEEALKVEFLAFVRGEQKFPSVEALKAQIAKDVQFAREFQSHDDLLG